MPASISVWHSRAVKEAHAEGSAKNTSSAYVSIRQHTSASVSICQPRGEARHAAGSTKYTSSVSIRLHTSAYVCIRQPV